MLVEPKLKDILSNKGIDDFFIAFAYLLDAGYNQLDAFSNAHYFYPFNPGKYFKVDCDYRNGAYYIATYIHPDEDTSHLIEFFSYCAKLGNVINVGKKNCEIIINNELIANYLIKEFKAIKTVIVSDISYKQKESEDRQRDMDRTLRGGAGMAQRPRGIQATPEDYNEIQRELREEGYATQRARRNQIEAIAGVMRSNI